jgi:hypothetical protein
VVLLRRACSNKAVLVQALMADLHPMVVVVVLAVLSLVLQVVPWEAREVPGGKVTLVIERQRVSSRPPWRRVVVAAQLVAPTVVEVRLVAPTVVEVRLVDPTVGAVQLVGPTVGAGRLVDPTVVEVRLVDPTAVVREVSRSHSSI